MIKISTLKFAFLAFVLCLISWETTQSDQFTFQRGNQKLYLQINAGETHLKWNEKAILKLKCENIDSKKLSLSAPGLSLIKGADENNESLWQIVPKKEYIKNDTLKLFVAGQDRKNKRWNHKFLILVKE